MVREGRRWEGKIYSAREALLQENWCNKQRKNSEQ